MGQQASPVRITTGHVVSSSSMVSRAYLTDEWRGIVVEDADGALWLAATLDALAPDPEPLLARGEEEGGLPREYARASLYKVSIGWGAGGGEDADGGEIDVTNPVVHMHPGGASVGLISLAKQSVLADRVAAGNGPQPLELHDNDRGAKHDRSENIEVATLFAADDGTYWPVRRQAWLASAPGSDFLGQPAVAIDVALQPHDAGSPVYSIDEPTPAFVGLARPVGANVSMLLPAGLIAETLADA